LGDYANLTNYRDFRFCRVDGYCDRVSAPPPWPDEALIDQAGSIGPAVLELVDSESRWVHRRIERIELVNATQLTRSVATDMTVPARFAAALGLYEQEDERAGSTAGTFVMPLGLLPKEALQDFTIAPVDVHRLTADQTNPLVVAALTPYARRCGAPPAEVLALAREIIRAENPSPAALARFTALIEGVHVGDEAARQRLLRLVTALNRGYLLLVAVAAKPGIPTRVTYTHRQVFETQSRGKPDEPPLVVEAPLPYAAGPGPSYRVEVLAPEGLEVESASIAAIEGRAWRPLVAVNRNPGDGAFVQLQGPDGESRPDRAGLKIVFGWPNGGVQHVAAIAGVVSTSALLIATLVSYWLNEKLKGSSASTLLAAPALVSGLALGFATTRITSRAANLLRIAALFVALVGVTGALSVSLLAENAQKLNVLHGVLIGCTILSALITAGFPGWASIRRRDRIPLAGEQ
jgi:hypothetical protein